MKTGNKLFMGGFIAVTLFLLACASTPAQTQPQSEEDRLKNEIKANPKSAKAYYDLGYYYCFNSSSRKMALAVKEWEKTLELDPNFRVNKKFRWTPYVALINGIETSSNIDFNDFSLNFLIAQELRESALSTSTDPEIAIAKNEKQSSLERSLILFNRGYEIDVTNRKNTNLRQIYLGAMAYTLDAMGLIAQANSYYTELAKVAKVTDKIRGRIGIVTETPKVAGTQQARQNVIDVSDAFGLTKLQLEQRIGKSLGSGTVQKFGHSYFVEDYPAKGTACWFYIDNNIGVYRQELLYVYSSDLFNILLNRFKKDHGEPEIINGMYAFSNKMPKNVWYILLYYTDDGAILLNYEGENTPER